MSRSLRVALLVVGLCLAAGFGFLAWRLVVGVRKQQTGITVVRRPGLRLPVAGAARKPARKPQFNRRNLAPMATVTVSSVQEGNGTSEGVADDSLDERHWVSAGETTGAWLQLEWNEPVTVSEIELHDLPSPTENILSGTLLFDDGSAVPVPPLPPDGSAWRTIFPPKTIRRLQFRIESVAGNATGLAEIMVYGPIQQP